MLLPENKISQSDTCQYQRNALEGVYITFLVKDTIERSQTGTNSIMTAKEISVAMNPDGTLLAGKHSIGIGVVKQDLKK